MSQKQLIKDYLLHNDFIVPAKMSGKIWKGQMFGSECSRRCRDLRDEGVLVSEPEGKFEKFILKESTQTLNTPNHTKSSDVEKWLEQFKKPVEVTNQQLW